MAKFKVDLGAAGKGSIVVDGVDVSKDTFAMAIFSRVGEPTTLQLHSYASGILEGEGIVEVIIENTEGLAEWLRQVDRGLVDEAAMNRGGWGDSSTLTDNVIDVLLEMLDAIELGPDPTAG